MNKHECVYDEEPVYFCSRCLSLEIKSDIADYCYCDKCGSTSINSASIFEWEKLYKHRYGHEFINNK